MKTIKASNICQNFDPGYQLNSLAAFWVKSTVPIISIITIFTWERITAFIRIFIFFWLNISSTRKARQSRTSTFPLSCLYLPSATYSFEKGQHFKKYNSCAKTGTSFWNFYLFSWNYQSAELKKENSRRTFFIFKDIFELLWFLK